MVDKWSYPEERVGETVVIDGERIKKLLTLDVNIPEARLAVIVNAFAPGSPEAKKAFVKYYGCFAGCDGCYNKAEFANLIMTLSEVIRVVDEAKELGLESIKFLGPGELLANPALFSILDALAERNIIVGIFTKAAHLGNDGLSRHYHGISSEELVRRLTAYQNTTFLVGCRSFDPVLENRFVPQNLREYSTRFNYHEARNIAIERLCNAGLNTDLTRQRMALIDSPVTALNIDGAFEIYKWGIERNIPVYIPPTMVSGRGHRLVKSASNVKFENDYIDLAVQVYTWAIERGVMTLEQLRREGAHPYIGVAPCNQLTHGLYIHFDGAVWRCPGNDTPDFVVHPNVRDRPLREIWKDSVNYKVNLFNNHCVKDGISLPRRFYTDVPERVRQLVGRFAE